MNAQSQGAMIAHPNMPGYETLQNLALNEDAAWKACLMDDPKGLRVINADGTLRHEDHRRIMEAVVAIRRRSLNGINDLMAAGLSSPESIGTMLVGRESINEFQAAVQTMNPTDLQNNSIDFLLKYVPLPIVHQGWRIPMRQLGFPYKQSLSMSESIRQVNEKLEDTLFNGDTSIQVDVNGTLSSITGYTTNAFRQTVSLVDWTDLATNRELIVDDALAMVDEIYSLTGGVAPNSCILYVGKDLWTNMQADYTLQKGDKTIKQRIEDIMEIKEVKPAEKLRSIETMLVEMSDRTVELAVAVNTTTVPVQRRSALEDQAFFTYASMVPIIKDDRNGLTGLVHGTRP